MRTYLTFSFNMLQIHAWYPSPVCRINTSFLPFLHGFWSSDYSRQNFLILIYSINSILHQNPVCTYTQASTHTKIRGKKLTEAIFNLTMCNELSLPFSTVFFLCWLLSIKFPLPLMGPASENYWFGSWFEEQGNILVKNKISLI